MTAEERLTKKTTTKYNLTCQSIDSSIEMKATTTPKL